MGMVGSRFPHLSFFRSDPNRLTRRVATSEYFGEHPILRVPCVLRTQVEHYFPPQDNRGDVSEDNPGEIA